VAWSETRITHPISGRESKLSKPTSPVCATYISPCQFNGNNRSAGWQPRCRRDFLQVDPVYTASRIKLGVLQERLPLRGSHGLTAPPSAVPNSRKAEFCYAATRCACGFESRPDGRISDHLLTVFDPPDSAGTDGQVHEEHADGRKHDPVA
jgi:hypothetical protein